MAQIKKETLDFLKQLKKNNDRDWFNKNKQKYIDANTNFIEFVGELLNKMSSFDKSLAKVDPKKCVFRIYRDVRFSKDKSPYKTHFGAWMAGDERPGKAGYYIHLDPTRSFIVTGVHQPESDRMKVIREDISMESKKFLKIIGDKTFKKNFGEMSGDKLKTVPKGFDKTDPMLKYIQHKDFIAHHEINEKTILSPKFSSYCTEIYKSALPFNTFLNAGLPPR